MSDKILEDIAEEQRAGDELQRLSPEDKTAIGSSIADSDRRAEEKQRIADALERLGRKYAEKYPLLDEDPWIDLPFGKPGGKWSEESRQTLVDIIERRNMSYLSAARIVAELTVVVAGEDAPKVTDQTISSWVAKYGTTVASDKPAMPVISKESIGKSAVLELMDLLEFDTSKLDKDWNASKLPNVPKGVNSKLRGAIAAIDAFMKDYESLKPLEQKYQARQKEADEAAQEYKNKLKSLGL